MKNAIIKLSLCSQGCCPTVEFDGNQVIIKDDWGGAVSLTTAELEILLAKYKTILGES